MMPQAIEWLRMKDSEKWLFSQVPIRRPSAPNTDVRFSLFWKLFGRMSVAALLRVDSHFNVLLVQPWCQPA